MARIYRVHLSGEAKPVAIIVAKSKDQAHAWAQGKYGASAEATPVSCKLALDSGSVCAVLTTKRITVNDTRPRILDAIV
jgi:hypothetical protein